MFVEITVKDLILSNLLVIGSILISLLFSKKFHWKILWATFRTFAQLIIVGYLLKYIFKSNTWYATLIMLFVMHFAAGFICLDSVGLSYKRMDFFFASFVSISISMGITFIITNIFVIHFKPWYRADYLIPLAGMIIGNNISAITLYHKSLSTGITNRINFINSLLAMGVKANRAITDLTTDAFKTGLMPTINAMLMIGIVKLPGMISGQIIGGSDVHQAVYYQIIVMLMITFASSISILIFRYMHTKILFINNAYLKDTA